VAERTRRERERWPDRTSGSGSKERCPLSRLNFPEIHFPRVAKGLPLEKHGEAAAFMEKSQVKSLHNKQQIEVTSLDF
jgi:hypothetical protein